MRPPVPINEENKTRLPPSYLTTEEAATEVRLSPRTLEKMRVQGNGPRFRKHGRRVLYARVDLEAWSANHAFEMTSDPGFDNDRRERP